jgi:hypothetical protein
MRVRVYRLVSNVLFGLSAALVWLAVPPRSPMITTLGLPGPSAAEGRLCRAALRRSSLGRVPTGEVMCRANFDPARPGFRASVFYDALSRRVTSAHAAFWKLDSLAVVALAVPSRAPSMRAVASGSSARLFIPPSWTYMRMSSGALRASM